MKSTLSRITRCLPIAALLLCGSVAQAAEKLKALIVDGQNNHAVWPKATVMMKQYLESTGQYEVDVERTRFIWMSEREKDWLPKAGAREAEAVKAPVADPAFNPDFSKYAVVVSNFGWNAAGWPEETRAALLAEIEELALLKAFDLVRWAIDRCPTRIEELAEKARVWAQSVA